MGEQSRSPVLAFVSAVSGQGAMAGPYVSARLTPNIFIDARAAWGLSDNKVNPFGQYQRPFASPRRRPLERIPMSGRVLGQMEHRSHLASAAAPPCGNTMRLGVRLSRMVAFCSPALPCRPR